jgi:hypothetical protein
MKFTTYVPTTDNDERPFDADFLERVIEQLWRPFKGMTEEGFVKGRWTSSSGVVYRDLSRKISIECGRERLTEAIRAVKRLGRRLNQKEMYFEVDGYDGVQFLVIE